MNWSPSQHRRNSLHWKKRAEAAEAELKDAYERGWREGHGWCDDGIDGMCTHQPGDPNPYPWAANARS